MGIQVWAVSDEISESRIAGSGAKSLVQRGLIQRDAKTLTV